MSTPTQHPVRKPIWKRALTVVGTVLVVFLVLRGLGSLMDDAVGFGKGGSVSAPQSSPTLPVEKPIDVPQTLSDIQLESPSGVIVTYLQANRSPWNNYGTEGWGNPVDTVSVKQDDVIVTLNQPFTNSTAYQERADEIRAWAVGELRQYKDNKTVASIDLVAVYSADGVMVGYEQL